MNRRSWLACLALAAISPDKSLPLRDRGAIVRGPRDRKRLSLVFTADRYAEGSRTILDALARRKIPAACFLTGRFLRDPEARAVVARIKDDGHEIGPHSDQHLLYASWERPPKLLVSRDQFLADLRVNDREIAGFVRDPRRLPYFLPPFEHYTEEIVRWTAEAGRLLINFTPGTLSHADYMEDDNPRFVAAGRIVDSILGFERDEPDGLSGFLLLMHLGAGPRRTRDHLHDRLPGLLDSIQARGYEFIRVSELLRPAT